MTRLIEALDQAGESPRALKKSKLHICTWWALAHVIKTIVDEHKTAYTIYEEVAEWCRKQPELIVRAIGPSWYEIREKGEDDGCFKHRKRFPL